MQNEGASGDVDENKEEQAPGIRCQGADVGCSSKLPEFDEMKYAR
jgi:hypothetical protein